MESLPNKTFHLVYHDIGFHHNGFTRWINSMVTPEVFADHLEQLSQVGTICRLDESLQDSNRDRPKFVLWFDDAYSGVHTYASSICQKKNVVATLAVNSEFALRKSCFWRSELSWLLEMHSAAEIANNIFSSPYSSPEEIWSKTLQQYGQELHHRITEMFKAKASIKERNAWHEIFMNEVQIRECLKNGWSVCNHSANHPALVSAGGLGSFANDFNQCRSFVSELGGMTDAWVVPFDYGVVKQAVDSHLETLKSKCTHLVRAFYFPEMEHNTIPRITIHGHQNVLMQIEQSIRPRSQSLLKKLKSLVDRFTHRTA